MVSLIKVENLQLKIMEVTVSEMLQARSKVLF